MPENGDPPHRFTAPPSTESGVHAPRRFSYTTRDIAATLADVGRGLSYRESARLLRARAHRRASIDGNGVADWVEIFAPVLHAHFARTRWPSVLELDSIVFRARGVADDDDATSDDGAAFQVFAALAPPRRGRAQIVALDVFPRTGPGGAQAHWEAFLRSRAGMPAQIVCDPDPALVRAIAEVWPPDRLAPAVFLCHRHLARELFEIVQRAGLEPDGRFYRAAARAFAGPAAWQRFLSEPPPRRLRPLDAWVEQHGARIASQLADRRGAQMTTELLEEHLALLHERLASRRGNLRNRERTRRLLMLLELELNGRADPGRYEEIIRDELLRRGGHAPGRRTIVDAHGPSLDA
jgi:hypothetical protein